VAVSLFTKAINLPTAPLDMPIYGATEKGLKFPFPSPKKALINKGVFELQAWHAPDWLFVWA